MSPTTELNMLIFTSIKITRVQELLIHSLFIRNASPHQYTLRQEPSLHILQVYLESKYLWQGKWSRLCFFFFSLQSGQIILCCSRKKEPVITSWHVTCQALKPWQCLWMKTADTKNEGVALSYAVSGRDNELSLFDYRKFQLWVGNSHWYMQIIISFWIKQREISTSVMDYCI